MHGTRLRGKGWWWWRRDIVPGPTYSPVTKVGQTCGNMFPGLLSNAMIKHNRLRIGALSQVKYTAHQSRFYATNSLLITLGEPRLSIHWAHFMKPHHLRTLSPKKKGCKDIQVGNSSDGSFAADFSVSWVPSLYRKTYKHCQKFKKKKKKRKTIIRKEESKRILSLPTHARKSHFSSALKSIM